MEEVLEKLKALAEKVPSPLTLPDEDELVTIEEQLLLPIPSDFRQYLLIASDVVYGHVEPAIVTDSGAHNYLPEMAAIAWSYGLPRYLLPFCETTKGYYCIDPDGLILLWEDGKFSDKQWDNLWQWIAEVWLQE